MQIIYGFKNIKPFHKPVVALGVFDGVHRVHRRILKYARAKSRIINGKAIVITFWPHPQKQQSLYSLSHRLNLIAQIGIDACLVIRSTPAFLKVSAHDFVKKFLVDKIGVNYVCVGENFNFGRGAQGDCRLLRELAKKYGFKLKVFPVVKAEQKIISSTRIRRLISTGKLTQAQKLLGRPVSIFGTVIKGASLGSKIGFPTANIDPHHEVIPPTGIYAVRVLFAGKKFPGVCYIGSRPSVPARGIKRRINIEAHIFSFRKNIYGKDLELQFIKKIREERKFNSLTSLIQQIRQDCRRAKRILSRH